jgi:hypothetical protein
MTISPADAAVAARSFPRRWRALFAMAEGDGELSQILERSGARRLAAQAAGVLESTAESIRGGLPTGLGTDDVLDALEAAADHLVRAIDNVGSDDWAGQRIETLTTGIDEAAALLRKAQRAIEDAA